MRKILRDNWRYLFLVPLLFAAVLTAFLNENDISLFCNAALLSYAFFILGGMFIGFVLLMGGTYSKVIGASFFVLLFILSQIPTLPILPFNIHYRYAFPAATLGLSALFYLFKANLDKLLFIVFFALFIGSFFFTKTSFIKKESLPSIESPRSDLPPYIHLVLDEHIGLEGMPKMDLTKELYHSLKKTYVQEGFRVFGRAFSRDFRSVPSFTSFLNFKPFATETLRKYIQDNDPDRFALRKNRYFEKLSQKGYAIHVIQSTYLDFCSYHEHFNLKSCLTYKHNAPNLENLRLSTWEKTEAIIGKIFSIMNIPITRYFTFPQFDNSVVGPSTASFKVFPEVLGLTKTIQNGHAYFIHLLFPHAPYVYNQNCEFVGEQKDKELAYYRQVQCSHKLIQSFLKELAQNPVYAKSTIIIQGDHGSRVIDPNEPHYEFTQENIIKNFSAFFIIKNTLFSPGYDLNEYALDDLLAEVLYPKTLQATRNKTVYLRSGNLYDLGKAAMPTFLQGSPT